MITSNSVDPSSPTTGGQPVHRLWDFTYPCTKARAPAGAGYTKDLIHQGDFVPKDPFQYAGYLADLQPLKAPPQTRCGCPTPGGLRVPAATLVALKGFDFSARYFLVLKPAQKGEKQRDGAKPNLYFWAGGRRRLLALTSHSLGGAAGPLPAARSAHTTTAAADGGADKVREPTAAPGGFRGRDATRSAPRSPALPAQHHCAMQGGAALNCQTKRQTPAVPCTDSPAEPPPEPPARC